MTNPKRKKVIRVKGDASHPSIWDDSHERNGSEQPLRIEHWHEWHAALLDRPDLCEWVGGEAVVREHRLMLCPPMAWDDGRGAAIGWPIYETGPVNLIRRFFDGKQPRYKGLGSRGHQIWPERERSPRYVPILLVAGMRDACWARAAGLLAFTTTGGVKNWPFKDDGWAYAREFTLCFDRGEEAHAERLAHRLREHGAKSVRVMPPPAPFDDLAELGEAKGVRAIHDYVRRRQ